MWSFLRNKSTEKDIRDWLTQNGYCGKSATFRENELHAIKRPGWLQIFRFELRCITAESRTVQLYGAMRSDERFGPPLIFVCEDVAARDSQLVEWSDGLITQRRYRK